MYLASVYEKEGRLASEWYRKCSEIGAAAPPNWWLAVFLPRREPAALRGSSDEHSSAADRSVAVSLVSRAVAGMAVVHLKAEMVR